MCPISDTDAQHHIKTHAIRPTDSLKSELSAQRVAEGCRSNLGSSCVQSNCKPERHLLCDYPSVTQMVAGTQAQLSCWQLDRELASVLCCVCWCWTTDIFVGFDTSCILRLWPFSKEKDDEHSRRSHVQRECWQCAFQWRSTAG